MRTQPILMAACLLGLGSLAQSQPAITKQPTDQSVSLGANVTMAATVTGVAPLSAQWRLNEIQLQSATNAILVVTNIQFAQAGAYSLVIADRTGSVTSRVAQIQVDGTFTKITAGAIATDRGQAWSCAWGDYNNDGFIDLVVGVTGKNFLYQNKGDGTFTAVTNSPIVTEINDPNGIAWGDLDNDGNLDLFISEFSYPHKLFRNLGGGVFAKSTRLSAGSTPGQGTAWGDYDNDGFLDLAVGVFQAGAELYRNNGDGTFIKTTRAQVGPLADVTTGLSCLWADYDNDGHLDLLFTQEFGQIQLYRNSGHGPFALVDAQHFPISKSLTASMGGAWGDFANRGSFDLFVVNGRSAFNQNDFYFRNNGDGSFTSLTSNQVGSVVADASTGYGCAAADYDNDGYLDLFVANPGLGAPGPPQPNALYHNNGDGSFSRISLGSLTSDAANSTSCAWGDYDNDGFMDLYVANGAWGGYGGAKSGFLYRNNRNNNHWITLKLVGTVSNRSAIGAKVRVKATIGGKSFWQLRQISGGGTFYGQDDMRPHFGLGDAQIVETVRIEWPSGTVQELNQVLPNQILTVIEPPRLQVRKAVFELKGGKSLQYTIQSSTNLLEWSPLTTLTATNAEGTALLIDPDPTVFLHRFYRAVSP